MTVPPEYKTDCRLFTGFSPCRHRRSCVDCPHYEPVEPRILLVQLGLCGDVLRTTALLPAIRRRYPKAHITWLTRPSAAELLLHNPLVDRVLKACELNELPADPRFFNVSRPLIGNEAAIALVEFAKNYEMVISAEDILDRFDEVKGRVEQAEASTISGVIEKVTTHCKDNEWKLKQAKNVAKFAEALGGEQLVSLWNSVSTTQNLPNIQKLHKLIGQKVVGIVQASRNV